MKIRYRGGYKYQLEEPYSVRLAHVVAAPGGNDFAALDDSGTLHIDAGYAWDGPSGPAIDTKNFMRGSLIHDALYQLIREGHIGRQWREGADKELRRVCIEDGMSRLRAWWVYRSVRIFGEPAATVGRPVLVAP